MKKLSILLLFSILAGSANTQTFDEWFKQKKTQKKYLLQQLAALQVYTGYLQKGYSIAKDGLSAINNIKNSEVSLHHTFYNSLGKVNPLVSKLPKALDIIRIQIELIKTSNKSVKTSQESRVLTRNEITYIKEVFGRLLTDCSTTIEALMTVVTSNKINLKDDERIKLIDELHADMQDKYIFSKSFSDQAKLLARNRVHETKDVHTIRQLAGHSPAP